MKFVVKKTKPGFFEDEYDVQLEAKTKKRLQIAVLGLAILAPAAYVVSKGPASPETENDPETLIKFD